MKLGESFYWTLSEGSSNRFLCSLILLVHCVKKGYVYFVFKDQFFCIPTIQMSELLGSYFEKYIWSDSILPKKNYHIVWLLSSTTVAMWMNKKIQHRLCYHISISSCFKYIKLISKYLKI